MQRVIIWSIRPGVLPRTAYIEGVSAPRPEVVRRAQEAHQRLGTRIEVWPSPMGTGERLLHVGRGGRLAGPWRPPRPAVPLAWLPLLEAFPSRLRGTRLVELPRTLDELVDELGPQGWTRRQVRTRLRRLDRRGLAECLEDNRSWRLTQAGGLLALALRKHLEVWGE